MLNINYLIYRRTRFIKKTIINSNQNKCVCHNLSYIYKYSYNKNKIINNKIKSIIKIKNALKYSQLLLLQLTKLLSHLYFPRTVLGDCTLGPFSHGATQGKVFTLLTATLLLAPLLEWTDRVRMLRDSLTVLPFTN